MSEGRPYPLWLKLAFTAWVAVLVPVWIHYQGWNNFLWLSDVAFLLTCVALWTESRLLTSMVAVGIVVPDGVWILLFLARLVEVGPFDPTGFMFRESLPLFVRGLSLFHVVLPPLSLWMVARRGYDRRALGLQTVLAVIILASTYLFTDPAENINMVFRLDGRGTPLPQPGWLLAVMVGLPLGAYLPTHLLLRRWKGD